MLSSENGKRKKPHDDLRMKCKHRCHRLRNGKQIYTTFLTTGRSRLISFGNERPKYFIRIKKMQTQIIQDDTDKEMKTDEEGFISFGN